MFRVIHSARGTIQKVLNLHSRSSFIKLTLPCSYLDQSENLLQQKYNSVVKMGNNQFGNSSSVPANPGLGVLRPGEDPKQLTSEEWKNRLPSHVYYVAREKGTERAFAGELYTEHRNGVYYCACCGAELFKSDHKYDSGSGWPSFYQPTGTVQEHRDTSHGMVRIEVTCQKCGAHLGHVFDDGPRPTGQRYCINSCSLAFKPKDGQQQ